LSAATIQRCINCPTTITTTVEGPKDHYPAWLLKYSRKAFQFAGSKWAISVISSQLKTTKWNKGSQGSSTISTGNTHLLSKKKTGNTHLGR